MSHLLKSNSSEYWILFNCQVSLALSAEHRSFFPAVSSQWKSDRFFRLSLISFSSISEASRRLDRKWSEKNCWYCWTKSDRIPIVRKATGFVNFYAAGLQLVPIFWGFQLDLIVITRWMPAGIRVQRNHWNVDEWAGSGRGGSTWGSEISIIWRT